MDFETEGDFPKFGNDDDRVDEIAKNMLTSVSRRAAKNPGLPKR